MKELAIRLRNDESGMSTAEYAVGTVAVTGFAGLLISLLRSPEVQALLLRAVQMAFSVIFG